METIVGKPQAAEMENFMQAAKPPEILQLAKKPPRLFMQAAVDQNWPASRRRRSTPKHLIRCGMKICPAW